MWDTQVFFSVLLGVVTAVGFSLVVSLLHVSTFVYAAAIPLGALLTIALVSVIDAREDRKFAEFTTSPKEHHNAAS